MESKLTGRSIQLQKQYRWVIVLYHAAKECHRVYGENWFDTMEDCEKDVDLDFDYCCGYDVVYESRDKPQ